MMLPAHALWSQAFVILLPIFTRGAKRTGRRLRILIVAPFWSSRLFFHHPLTPWLLILGAAGSSISCLNNSNELLTDAALACDGSGRFVDKDSPPTSIWIPQPKTHAPVGQESFSVAFLK